MLKNLNLKELARLMRLMGSRRWKFYISFFVKILSITGLVVFNSFIAKIVVNGVVSGEEALLLQGLILMAIAILLVTIVSPLTSYLSMYYAKKTIYEIRSDIYNHLLTLPGPFFDDNSSGQILSRLTNDLNKIDSIYSGELYTVLESFAIGSVSVILTFILEWRLALVILVLGTLTFVVNTLYAKPLRVISQRVQSILASSTQRFIDLIAGNRIIKLFNIQQLIYQKFERENSDMIEENIRLVKKESEKEGLNFILSGTFYLGVLGAGAAMVSQGIIDMGTVVAIFTLRLGVSDLFTKFGSSLTSLQKSMAGVNRVFEVIDQREEDLDQNIYIFNTELKADRNILNIKDLEFSYDRGDEVLKGIDLQVKKGNLTALVGLSGAGKSTVIKLLLGIYKPLSGEIELNGINKYNSRLKTLRNQFSYVSQDAYLFDCSIEENIRYGKTDATKEEIISAAKAAKADYFINQLPDGYKTVVGEKSTKLSGGQRQRIAIARALLKDAPILLLDEATSALDSESELQVRQAIQRLMDKKTTIVIAHRLSTIQRADQIYVLDGGKIVEQGNHPELLNKNGVYHNLYSQI